MRQILNPTITSILVRREYSLTFSPYVTVIGLIQSTIEIAATPASWPILAHYKFPIHLPPRAEFISCHDGEQRRVDHVAHRGPTTDGLGLRMLMGLLPACWTGEEA